MGITVVALGGMRIAAIKVIGRQSELSHRVPMAWLELKRRAPEIAGIVDPGRFYGVFPEFDQLENGANGVFTYWVGIQVADSSAIPEGFETLAIPSRNYASTTVQGGGERIQATYLELARWLRENGRRTDRDSLGFELYDETRQKVTPPYERFDYEIYRPLAD